MITAILILVAVFAALWIWTCLCGEVCDLLIFWWQKR